MVRGQVLPTLEKRAHDGMLLKLEIHYSDQFVYEAVDTLRDNGRGLKLCRDCAEGVRGGRVRCKEITEVGHKFGIFYARRNWYN